MEEGKEPLTWTVQRGEKENQKRWIVGTVIIVAAMLAALWLNLLAGIIAALALFASTAEIFLPQRYRLDEKGATVRLGISVTSITWDEVKRLVEEGDAVRLSPLEKESRLDAFRGVLLRFNGNREAALDRIRELWETDDGSVA